MGGGKINDSHSAFPGAETGWPIFGAAAVTPVAPPKAASAAEVSKAIDRTLKSRGGAYATYSCKTVSWDDASRSGGFGGSNGGGLSCWGSNITDTYLKAKDGTRLFTVRPDNWNEKLGLVSTDDVALVTGNTEIAAVNAGTPLQPTTLSSVLQSMGRFGKYAGLEHPTNLSKPELDTHVSIRFQTTFLPVDGGGGASGNLSSRNQQRGTFEFATEAYNYNTQDDGDPRNLVLLCTTQGLAVQQDGKGAKKLFHHVLRNNTAAASAASAPPPSLFFGGANSSSSSSVVVSRHWLEAESSDHQVGFAQNESAAERADALARGKATSSVIGTQSMGTRFNVLMTIQVPLEQQQQQRSRNSWGGGSGFGSFGGGGGGGGFQGGGGFTFGAAAGGPPSAPGGFGAPPAANCSFGAPAAGGFGFVASASPPAASSSSSSSSSSSAQSFSLKARKKSVKGTAKAARVSIGSKHDDHWSGLSCCKKKSPPPPPPAFGASGASGSSSSPNNTMPKRHPSERLTVTVVLYNTVAGGVPSSLDVAAAVDDMEQLYASCSGGSGLLDEGKFDVIKNGGSGSGTITHQAPPPLPASVANFSAFPTTPTPPPQFLLPPAPASFAQFCASSSSSSSSSSAGFNWGGGQLPPPPAQPTIGSVVAAPSAASDEVKELVALVTELSPRAFTWLHDNLALPWLAGGVAGGRLVDAYHVLLASNALHVALHGEPNAVAFYNLGCCLSVACRDHPQALLPHLLGSSTANAIAAAAAAGHGGGGGGATPQAVVSQQLFERGCETALKWVRLARASGYADMANMTNDPDLSAIRTHFGVLVVTSG
jgi:hypothetical protein